MLEIKTEELEIVKSILKKHLSSCEVRAFGSRVNNAAKSYSDLDLVIIASEKISRATLFALEDDFEESNLPFRVEILDWHRISEEFRKIINKKNISIIFYPMTI